jgi:DNA-binding IclR family transcriptional regulator
VTLAEQHLVAQDEFSGKYGLGPAMYDLSAAVATKLDLHAAVTSPMEQLRAATGEAVRVAVLDGREVVYVGRLDSANTLRPSLEVGRRNWAHCTATGKVLLAFQSDHVLDALFDGWELPSVSEFTITSSEQLRREIRTIRSQGHAHNVSESEVGVLSVSAPIRDLTDGVRAALSVAGPQQRMEPMLDQITLAVKEMAAAASRRLGSHR